jgi:hypothetical protein
MKETRRQFLTKAAKAAFVPVLTLEGLNFRTVYAKTTGGHTQSPAELMESYAYEVLAPNLLPPSTPFEVITQPIGRSNLLHHAYPYESADGRKAVLTLTATPTGDPRLQTAQLFEEGVTGNIWDKFSDEPLNAAVSGFKTPPLLDSEPWNVTNSDHLPGRPPIAEKTILAPEGYMVSLSARLNGLNPPYQMIYAIARAHPESIQFSSRTALIPTE